ncbi:cytokine-dependent hematopoietic cell linker [Willisornis vidua]|uniref:Cytokine-dependent hematopoietic cell linker n=1 Tax=Willisornis vidua TaxID=1566151 RepID=A0ABQ9CWK0_9PASS|nr:cytokine-dependent hematopoietic cell linker [Willisornis vidua]
MKITGIKLNKFSKYLTMKGKGDLWPSPKLSEEDEDEYETVSSSTLDAMNALRILPAKPPQESEYADKRCLKPSVTTSPMSEDTSQPLQYPTDPMPPPRPPNTLPKPYQPLPPEPRVSSQFFHKRNTLSQAPTFPISAKVTRHLSVKELNELQVWGRNLKYIFKHNSIILKPGSTLNVENLALKRSPSPTSYTACKNKSKHSLVEQEMQSLTQTTEKDETFLVRDCSKKSRAEPYVLVVYYGRRVYNIKVRFLEESQQYALGTGLRGDDKFNSVEEIIEYYKYVPITLIDGKDQSGTQREQCYLTYPFKSRRYFLP